MSPKAPYIRKNQGKLRPWDKDYLSALLIEAANGLTSILVGINMLPPVKLKKLKLNGPKKTYKTF